MQNAVLKTFSLGYIQSWAKRLQHFFSMSFGIPSDHRAIGSYLNKNQSLDDQTVFRNSSKKKCCNLLAHDCTCLYHLVGSSRDSFVKTGIIVRLILSICPL